MWICKSNTMACPRVHVRGYSRKLQIIVVVVAAAVVVVVVVVVLAVVVTTVVVWTNYSCSF